MSDQAALADVLEGRRVHPRFQPVIDLDLDVTVGYEALARVPDGPMRAPAQLFEAGRAAGRLVELDWLCRERAVELARGAGLRHPLSLFVNAEPETLLDAENDAARWRSFGDLRCYAELTERALAARPAALLRAIDQVRERDWGIALDDVGADPDSLALLPIVRPDVIELDLRLLQATPAGDGDTTVARVLHAALCEAGQTGAVVVAEGIETPQHLDLARAYGARYGQGFLLGRPEPLPTALRSPPVAVPLLSRVLDRAVAPSPFTVVAGATTSRSVSRDSVREVARQLLAQAADVTPEPVVLVCVNGPTLLDGPVRALLASLDDRCLARVTGTAVALARLPGLRGQPLPPGDPASEDFDVVVIGGHFATALVTRPSLPLSSDGRLDLALSFDRDLVSGAANALLRRVDGAPLDSA